MRNKVRRDLLGWHLMVEARECAGPTSADEAYNLFSVLNRHMHVRGRPTQARYVGFPSVSERGQLKLRPQQMILGESNQKLLGSVE